MSSRAKRRLALWTSLAAAALLVGSLAACGRLGPPRRIPVVPDEAASSVKTPSDAPVESEPSASEADEQGTP